jgi:hypothetical protein
MIEVLVSIAILTIGLIGTAAMVCMTMITGTNAKYVNIASVLASDKLDNLNKWPSGDPNVQPGGALAGPLNCATGDSYCDQVTVSEINGADYVTQSQLVFDPLNPNNPPTPSTTTIVHTLAGCVNTPTNCGVANPVPGPSDTTFTRRWLITANPVVTNSAGAPTTLSGALRVSVNVTLTDRPTNRPVEFQMSMVRP